MILNPDLAKLYRAGYTQIEHEQTRKLGGKRPLATWLLRYYSSHATPYPVTIDKIHRLSGSQNPHKGSFTRQLKNALQSLIQVGCLQSFKIKNGKVFVQRS